MKRLKLKSVAAAAGVTLLASQAAATGLLVARFGGEHGHPTTDNPTAIYYNPAGLSLGKGTRLFIDGSLAWRAYSFDRSPDAVGRVLNGSDGLVEPTGGTPAGDGVAANSGKSELFNVLASPFFGVATDFGVEGLGVGAAFYVPIGGQSKWDGGDAVAGFPGGQDGSQRWWVMEGTIRSLYISGAASYKIKPANLSIGVGVNLIKSEINTVRARNGDGSDDLVNRTPRTDQYPDGEPGFYDNIKEGRGLVDLSSWDLGLGVGLVYQPTDELYIGLSYQSQPGFGEQELTGDAKKILAQSDNEDDEATATQSMPDVVRWGIRYNYGKGEARLFGDYARWSLFEKQCISTKGRDDCDLANIPRNWEDAFGIRAGYSYFMNDNIELYFGGGYDGNAVPDEYLEPALFDAEKFSGALGGRFVMLDGALAIAATYTQIFYVDRETEAWPRDPNTGRLIPQGDFATAFNPNSAGKYSQSIGVLNLNAQYAF